MILLAGAGLFCYLTGLVWFILWITTEDFPTFPEGDS